LLDHTKKLNIPFAYNGSWTVHPEYRKDESLKEYLRGIFQAMMVYSHLDLGSYVISGCTMRFKVDQWLVDWGFEPLRGKEGVDLPPIKIPFLQGEEVKVMVLKKVSKSVLLKVRAFQKDWENRIILGMEMPVIQVGGGTKKAG
jgi:hypothetical protein